MYYSKAIHNSISTDILFLYSLWRKFHTDMQLLHIQILFCVLWNTFFTCRLSKQTCKSVNLHQISRNMHTNRVFVCFVFVLQWLILLIFAEQLRMNLIWLRPNEVGNANGHFRVWRTFTANPTDWNVWIVAQNTRFDGMACFPRKRTWGPSVTRLVILYGFACTTKLAWLDWTAVSLYLQRLKKTQRFSSSELGALLFHEDDVD